MALKPTVHERCPRCGEQAATLEGELVKEWHRCPAAPPGPSDPPRTHHIDHIRFIRGDWTNEELRQQLDDARAAQAIERADAAELRRRLKKVCEAIGAVPGNRGNGY